MTKVLVTGGSGFIGAHLTDELIKKKYKVMVVDSLKSKGGIPFINPLSKFYKGDITKKKTLNLIEKWKPDIIFHLAAQSASESAYDNPQYDYLTNGYGTFLLAKLAKKIKVKKFIYTSSVAVYGSNTNSLISETSKINPDSIYGISKYTGEMFIRQILYNTKVKTCIFRVFNTYGPGENLNFLKKGMVSIYSSYIWKKKPIVVKGSLNRFRNFTFIDDCIKFLILSINNKKLKNHELFNLSSAKKITVKNLINKILKINNLKNYKLLKKESTPGDSFGYNCSNKYLLKKFPKVNFLTLEEGIKRYFKWIKVLPQKKNLSYFHPLNLKK
jgi:UDP-glucose 4-epimerase